MAHIAAMMNKRRKDQQQRAGTELSLKVPVFPQEDSVYEPKHLPYTYTGAPAGASRSTTQTPSKLVSRTSEGTLKTHNSMDSKNASQQSLRRMDSKRRETISIQNEDGSFASPPPPQSYSFIYVGLILLCMGLVVSFVGLGDKGFKTTELRLIGPVLSVIGILLVAAKVLHCSFPHLFTCSSAFKKAKNKPKVDQSNLVEKGLANGHIKITSTNNTPRPEQEQQNLKPTTSGQPELSPRVTLKPTAKSSRPRSTIPNYIEDSSDDDDFDPGRAQPHTNKHSSYELQQKENKAEILLTPRSLML